MEFDQAYKEYFHLIYKFAYRIIGDEYQANDIAQETFVKLHRSLNSTDVIDNPKAWLYRVAANISNNHLKRNSIHNRIIRSIRTDSEYDNIEADFIKKERILLVRGALEKLSTKERTLLLLYQDGLSYTEMAKIINIRKTSVGKMLSRAIEKCAGYIGRQ